MVQILVIWRCCHLPIHYFMNTWKPYLFQELKWNLLLWNIFQNPQHLRNRQKLWVIALLTKVLFPMQKRVTTLICLKFQLKVIIWLKRPKDSENSSSGKISTKLDVSKFQQRLSVPAVGKCIGIPTSFVGASFSATPNSNVSCGSSSSELTKPNN